MTDHDYNNRLPSVTLVSLPWTSLTEPSLGLGILKAELNKNGIPCTVMHLNLFLLEYLRSGTYYAIANVFGLNDFIFSGVIDPIISTKQRQWLRLKALDMLSFNQLDEKELGGLNGVEEKLINLRQEIIPAWLNKWAEKIAESDATMIGFTCMFDQTIASIALAHLIRKRTKDKLLVLGGYAVRQPTGQAIMRSFPCIDAVCDGEGEPAIARLALASVDQLSLANIPNIIYKNTDNKIVIGSKAPLVNMNNVPVPDYDDFFIEIDDLLKNHKIRIEVDRLPLENSRGCWWGQTKHCVFCGINDEDLRYRFKDAALVIKSMDTLNDRYSIPAFRFSDYILPHTYFKTLLQDLINRGSPYKIISEMKANINNEQFSLLAKAGFDEVQPGIESFSSKVLQKMDKGVTASQNVYTLLLGKINNVAVRYNILYGLPDDDPGEIDEMIKMLPRLFHLDPPSTRLQTQITRFAPLQTDPARFGIRESWYEPSYDIIFSSGFLNEVDFDLNDYCYYFERTYENSPELNRLYKQIDIVVDQWKSQQDIREVTLTYKDCEDGIEITDTRYSEEPEKIFLNKYEATIFRSMSGPANIDVLKNQYCKEQSPKRFKKCLDHLDDHKLIFKDRDKWIALAVPQAQIEINEMTNAISKSSQLVS